MNKQEALQILSQAPAFFEQQSAGYKSWGKVEVLQIAIRLEDKDILSENVNKELGEDQSANNNTDAVFHAIFDKRKKVNVILLTKQEYASQVKREIPPILDDQAQLLGVSVRLAKNEKDIAHALNGRFAAILPDGTSICLGTTLEDAYVAAQLLEKTSKAFVEAAFLGGAKPINRIEAWLMQQFYQFKYSKEARKNK